MFNLLLIHDDDHDDYYDYDDEDDDDDDDDRVSCDEVLATLQLTLKC